METFCSKNVKDLGMSLGIDPQVFGIPWQDLAKISRELKILEQTL